MISSARSIWIWTSAVLLILIWLPLLSLIRITDRDPVHYRTGLWFRRLGRTLGKLNPGWKVHIAGDIDRDPRHPYVVVSNHQSLADIPIIAQLPWEMKWVAKAELFRIPVAGWMMKLAGDIPVDRKDTRSGTRMLLTALAYLKQKCSIMFFPEGTRSIDGRVGRFNDGAFHLAVKAQVPILPLVVEGSRNCIPKKTWRFGGRAEVYLRVLPPVDTSGFASGDIERLRNTVREMIIRQLAEWRGLEPGEVDSLERSIPV